MIVQNLYWERSPKTKHRNHEVLTTEIIYIILSTTTKGKTQCFYFIKQYWNSWTLHTNGDCALGGADFSKSSLSDRWRKDQSLTGEDCWDSRWTTLLPDSSSSSLIPTPTMVTLPLAWGCRAGGLGSHILQNQTIQKIESISLQNNFHFQVMSLRPLNF